MPLNLQKNNMKTTKFIAFALFAITLSSCGNKVKESQKADERMVEEVDSATGVIRLTSYAYNDTIHIDDKTYSYDFAFSSVDSLPVITNSQGVQYYDNEVKLTIKRDSTIIYSHTFRKHDFNDIVPSDFLKASSLVGFNYNVIKRDDRSALYFIAMVGDPDESAEITYPVEIKISTGGAMSMEHAKDLETEPLHSGMNQDPNDDCGV